MRRFLRRLRTLISRIIWRPSYLDGPGWWGECFVVDCVLAEFFAGRVPRGEFSRRADAARAANDAHNRWAGLCGPVAYWFNALTAEEEHRLSDWQDRHRRRVHRFIHRDLSLAEFDAQSLADPCPPVPAVDTPWRRLAQGYRRICEWLDEG